MLNIEIDKGTGWLTLTSSATDVVIHVPPHDALKLGQAIMEHLGPHAARIKGDAANSSGILTDPHGQPIKRPLTSPVPQTPPRS